jgi:hypothetical protein
VGPKEVVGRRVEDVITGGRLELIDELFMPDDTPGARAWIEPFRRAFPDVEMKIVELVAGGGPDCGPVQVLRDAARRVERSSSHQSAIPVSSSSSPLKPT